MRVVVDSHVAGPYSRDGTFAPPPEVSVSRQLHVFVAALLLMAGPVSAAPAVGFSEHWSAGLAGWSSSATVTNPGSGGVRGDGFLMVSTPGPGPAFTHNLGVQSSGVEYTGDWQAAGITQVRLWLEDVGNPDPLEIHFAIGDANNGNFWQYDTGFIPAAGVWTPFVVDLTSSAGFTHIINATGGTFDDALRNVNRVLIRHDHAPYVQTPDPIVADFGIDELLLTNGLVGVTSDRESAPHPLSMTAPYPNPARGPVAVTLEVGEIGSIQIAVVDVTGRIVRRASLSPDVLGPHVWAWDGTSEDGRRAPAGVYRIRAIGRSGGMSRPVVLLGR
jgi:hypothetical protein